jgi:hypothetical protein
VSASPSDNDGGAVADPPPPPWSCSGQIHLGLVRADRPAELPEGFAPLLGRKTWGIGLLRYLEGPLCYDELVVGPMVRRGTRPGILVRHIFVDDPVSRRGGREIWGLPKELARFAWSEGAVEVSDDAGPLARLAFEDAGLALPDFTLPCLGFGLLDGRWTHVVMRFHARFRRARLGAPWLSDRFGFRAVSSPFAVHAARFDAVIEAPRLLDATTAKRI